MKKENDNEDIVEAGITLLADDIDFAALRNHGFLVRIGVAIRQGYRRAKGVYGLSKKLKIFAKSPATTHSIIIGEMVEDIRILDEELSELRWSIKDIKDDIQRNRIERGENNVATE